MIGVGDGPAITSTCRCSSKAGLPCPDDPLFAYSLSEQTEPTWIDGGIDSGLGLSQHEYLAGNDGKTWVEDGLDVVIWRKNCSRSKRMLASVDNDAGLHPADCAPKPRKPVASRQVHSHRA